MLLFDAANQQNLRPFPCIGHATISPTALAITGRHAAKLLTHPRHQPVKVQIGKSHATRSRPAAGADRHAAQKCRRGMLAYSISALKPRAASGIKARDSPIIWSDEVGTHVGGEASALLNAYVQPPSSIPPLSKHLDMKSSWTSWCASIRPVHALHPWVATHCSRQQ